MSAAGLSVGLIPGFLMGTCTSYCFLIISACFPYLPHAGCLARPYLLDLRFKYLCFFSGVLVFPSLEYGHGLFRDLQAFCGDEWYTLSPPTFGAAFCALARISLASLYNVSRAS